MSRIVRIDQDLSGQTLDASAQPDGHARESLVQRCTLDATTRFIGDLRGTDYLANDGPADWSAAQTYGSYWRGNLNLSGSKWPADIGYMQAEPLATIIHDRTEQAKSLVPAGKRTQVQLTLTSIAQVLTEEYDPSICWPKVMQIWREGMGVAQDVAIASDKDGVRVWRWLFRDFPAPLRRLEQLWELADQIGPGNIVIPAAKTVTTVCWPDGAKVVVNSTALPTLPDPSRYTLARWIESEADKYIPETRTDLLPEQPMSHYCFVWNILLANITSLGEPDGWLTRLDGY